MLHVAVWAIAGTLSRSNLDLPGDMIEAAAWGQVWQWGYFKHPPLMAWMAGAWFSVMPNTHWSYALLASVNTAIGVAGFVLLCREFVSRRWVWVCLAAIMLAPGVTTMAMRFNANTVLIATWPWAAAFFVRYMKRGQLRDALGCALLCALAMLGKYFSAVMIGSLLASGLLHAPWRKRLLQPAALAAVGLFFACMAPHLVWLVEHGFGPLAYAHEATQNVQGSALWRGVRFALCHLLFPALGFVLMWLAVRKGGRHGSFFTALRGLLVPSTDPVWVLAMAPLLLTAFGTAITGARTSVVWGLPMAMGLVLFVAQRLEQRGHTPDLAAAAKWLVSVWVAVLIVAPLSWEASARKEAPTASEPRQELSQAIETAWLREVGTPLRWVSGTEGLALSTSFYSAQRPHYWAFRDPARQTPWVDLHSVQHQGGVLVCELNDIECRQKGFELNGRMQLLTVAKEHRGHRFAPRSFAVYLVAPFGAELPAFVEDQY